jgi:hypothetical protein
MMSVSAVSRAVDRQALTMKITAEVAGLLDWGPCELLVTCVHCRFVLVTFQIVMQWGHFEQVGVRSM